jgi:hypothetical protein
MSCGNRSRCTGEEVIGSCDEVNDLIAGLSAGFPAVILRVDRPALCASVNPNLGGAEAANPWAAEAWRSIDETRLSPMLAALPGCSMYDRSAE